MTKPAMCELVHDWMAEVLDINHSILETGLRQRAKFEGWLKFELALHAQKRGASDVLLERQSEKDHLVRADISFTYGAVNHVLQDTEHVLANRGNSRQDASSHEKHPRRE
jgi:hypothetical protein